MENTAVIVLLGLNPEEKAKVMREAKSFCDKHQIELVTNLPAPTQDGTNYVQCTCRNGLEAFKNCGHGQEEPPTQDGTAEEVLQELLDIEYHDDPQYANLESALISRKYCIQAMHNYDAPLRAEIEEKNKRISEQAEKLRFSHDRIGELKSELAASQQRVAELEEAIKWALGENGEFVGREVGQGAFWWRTELRRRSKF